ncbi:inositol monophosphatase family protein [bacterium endosymbiont of Pedicinus badii]|uniref:inositol monophosphatase family protein n=1 Tax=bacterium endosymbiont of Pedicinus badii TaxID=1719126 RepID=UPI0018A8661B|nr:inositol monophosphatase family protein [bacterium endosymbiont of Pedicinus badii]
MLNIAIQVVRLVGKIVFQYYEFPQEYKKKNISKIQDYIFNIARKRIKNSYSNHTILYQKKKNNSLQKNGIHWILNPIVGKNNFIKCFPHFAIMASIFFGKKIKIAVVYDPMKNEIFSAIRGRGAQINGYRIRVGSVKNVNFSTFSSDYFYKKNEKVNKKIKKFERIFSNSKYFLSTGCQILDTVYVSSGRIDFILQKETKYLFNNYLVNELFITESGGIIKKIAIKKDNFIILGNPYLVNKILLLK